MRLYIALDFGYHHIMISTLLRIIHEKSYLVKESTVIPKILSQLKYWGMQLDSPNVLEIIKCSFKDISTDQDISRYFHIA